MQWLTWIISLVTAVLNFQTTRINNRLTNRKDADRANGQHQE